MPRFCVPLVIASLLVLIGCNTAAQPPAPTPEAMPVQEGAPLVVMNTAAHPDDEDGSTLTYYRHAKDAVAYSVIFTRGEGGQNEIGPELYEALGAIRTDESERAARHLGTQLYFLNFSDFGYSKSAEESYERWGGRDHVTARLVYLIRKLKPDVLFTNHDTVTVGPRKQHGHHQAVGNSTYDAFSLAADASYHPEQLDENGVDLWQPKRLFLRNWRGQGDYDVTVPIGATNPATEAPYTAYAADALREHASQGMDRWADRIQSSKETYFTLLRTATDAPLDTTDLASNLASNTAATPPLSYKIDAGRLPSLPEGTLTIADDVLVPGQRVQLSWKTEQLPTRRLRWEFHGAIDTTLHLTDDAPGFATLTVSTDAIPTTPHVTYQYERFLSRSPVYYAAYRAGTDEIVAAGYLPVELAPPVFVEAATPDMRLRPGLNQLPIRAQVYDPAAEQLTLNVAVSNDAAKTVIYQEQQPLRFEKSGAVVDTLALNLPADLADGTYTITLTALAKPALRTPQPATAHATGRVFDVRVPEGLNVGVVQSYDNTLAQALTQLGVTHTLLDAEALATGDLDVFDTILIDIRAYLVRGDLRTHNDRVLDWVQRGGHLVVNYQKTFEWNADYDDPFEASRKNPAGFAPYPLTLGRDRVTREDATVHVLHPEQVLMNRPNEITAAAWDGWVQERGLYFPETHDDRYEQLFCMNDPNEQPLCRSTLLADYGEGTYLYTALVWYRQLKVFHPGAYALFANLISMPLVEAPPTTGAVR